MNQQEGASPAAMFDQFFGPALFAPGARLLLEQAAPQPDEHVLDLACGTGTVARCVAPAVGGAGRVVGVDINPGMLAVATSHPSPAGAPIEWLEGNASGLDLADGSFDLVLCQQGLQFFADRAAAVREMRRGLRNGGRMALNVWQALDRHPVYEALCTAEARHLHVPLSEVASPWSLPDANDLRTLLTEAGFRQVQVTSRTFDAHFPSPERFVYLTLFAAAAFMPDFDWDDEVMRSALIDSVTAEAKPIMQRYRDGERLTFPVWWHVGVAWK